MCNGALIEAPHLNHLGTNLTVNLDGFQERALDSVPMMFRGCRFEKVEACRNDFAGPMHHQTPVAGAQVLDEEPPWLGVSKEVRLA